ncbi:MAG TPA: prolyl oligopeptidase family serine peptidase [Chitinophagaceae bacterium]|nr:prolyl oligopeptidase family serine peptidase [Chitinophagaceae bacterium]
MKHSLASVVIFFSSIHFAFAQNSIQPGETTAQITVDNISRTFIVYVPGSYTQTKKSPLIFLLHGGGANAASMLNISNGDDFKSISERDNVLLVAPQGIDKSWNDGRGTKSNKQGINDVKFISSLIDYMEAHYSVDASRMYATGISNGGFMTSRLGCEIGYKFAAIAAVAATMGTDTPYSSCKPNFVLPVMYIHGTADPIVPFNGGAKTIGAEGAFVSHQQVIDKWVAIDQCNTTPAVTHLPNTTFDGTTITKEAYSDGKDGTEVISYIIHDGGHTWPGGKQYLPKMVIGRVSRDMNGCEVIWDFFKQHTRQE